MFRRLLSVFLLLVLSLAILAPALAAGEMQMGSMYVNTANGKVPRSRFSGQDEEHRITNVVLQNVTILGKPMGSPEEMKISMNEFCDSITVR